MRTATSPPDGTATSPPAPSPRGGEGGKATARGAKARGRGGFTFVELVVVWAIIAVLIAILFPVFARAREKARQATCVSNLRNISAALRIYGAENYGHLPPTDNDVTTLYPKYLAESGVYKCPSVGDRRIIPYPPAPPPPTPPPVPSDGKLLDGPTPREAVTEALQRPPAPPQPGDAIVSTGIPFDYVYRGGLCDDDLPNQAVMADDMPERHNGGGNVLMLSGSVKWFKPNYPSTTYYGNDENSVILRPLDEARRDKSIRAGAHPPELTPPPPARAKTDDGNRKPSKAAPKDE